MGRLFVGLAVGLAIGLTHESPGPVLPRLETAIARDARARFHTRILRTRCERFQRDATRFSCTAVQFETALSYTGQVYVARVRPDGSFSFRPHKIPLYLGI